MIGRTADYMTSTADGTRKSSLEHVLLTNEFHQLCTCNLVENAKKKRGFDSNTIISTELGNKMFI